MTALDQHDADAGGEQRLRRAASSMSARLDTGMPASVSASGRLGVTTRARGRSEVVTAPTAPASRSASPEVAAMTGSTTSRSTGRARKPAPTARTLASVPSMPHLAASVPKSSRTDESWVATSAGDRNSTAWTPREFCAVTAVMTDMPKTR